jgi:hypothetical protein
MTLQPSASNTPSTRATSANVCAFAPRTTLAALAAAVLLAACGGGGGGDSAGPSTNVGAPGTGTGTGTGSGSPTTPATPTVTPPATITLTPTAAPAAFTAADCNRLQSDDVALAALNLNNPQINLLNTVTREVDPKFAWRMFIRAPETFIKWVIALHPTTMRLDASSMSIAAHETFHEISFALTYLCPTVNTYKMTWANTTYATELRHLVLPRYNIVDTVLPSNLKSSSRYSLYILDLGNSSGNDFRLLMDELAAYTGGAVAEYRWIATRGEPNWAIIDSGLAGMVEFMAWTQAYLQAVRTTNPTAWNLINQDAQAKAALQAVWTEAENTLQAAYAQTRSGASPRLVYDPLVFDYVYQAGPLNELALLGITTRTRGSWVGSYL